MSSSEFSWDEGFQVLNRVLQDKDVPVDFSILAVFVVTLGLVLIVELIRHQLDHFAEHRPFLHHVLERVYEELSILGIVEAGIFLLIAYYPDLDKKKKEVFGDVHFLLFFTAVINALQTILLAYLSRQVSNKLWVNVEDVELSHYVVIREEFERIHAIYQKRTGGRDDAHTMTSEEAFQLNVGSIRDLWDGIVQHIRDPALMQKHHKLLVQVRFHELRVHFLQANELPAEFRVSDYLKSSELHVLKELAKVTTSAWILFTGACNLLYYGMGIVAWINSETTESHSEAMAYTYFGSNVFFVLLAILVFNKMKGVFAKIMNMKFIDFKDDGEEDESLLMGQKNLFWAGNPDLVIGLIKFMEFGYAVCAAILIIFWDNIQKDGAIPPIFMLCSVMVCYTIFVVVTAHVIPRFTLCTSLGQLVNKHRLQETLSKYKLQQALVTAGTAAPEYNIDCDDYKDCDDDEDDDDCGESKNGMSYLSANSNSTKLTQLSELVQTKTEHLRTSLRTMENIRSTRAMRRLNRKKSISDSSVFQMRMMGDADSIAADSRGASTTISEVTGMEFAEHSTSSIQVNFDEDDGGGKEPPSTSTRSARRNRRKSLSADVDLMRTTTMETAEDESELFVKNDSAKRLGVPPIEERGDDIVHQEKIPSPLSPLPRVSSPSKSPPSQEVSAITKTDGLLIDPAALDMDVQSTQRSDKSSSNMEVEDLISNKIMRTLRSTLGSPAHQFLSGVFGTMVCFFFVAMRVEALLLAARVIYDPGSTFHFSVEASFWMVFLLLVIFILVSALMVVVFRGQRRDLVIASVFDIVLCVICLVLLIVGETERCCEAGTTDVQSGVGGVQLIDVEDDKCTCSVFGTRSYGSVGSIEPYTALVALRVCRFWLGRKICACMFSKSASPLKGDGVHAKHDVEHPRHHGADMSKMTGNVLELWQQAVSLYPDVVEKNGAFSGELLQAMLGVSGHPALARGERQADTGEKSKRTPAGNSRSARKPVEYLELTTMGNMDC